jgi:hypothetical protein
MRGGIDRRLAKIEAATGGPSYVVAFAGEAIPPHAGKLVIVVPRRGVKPDLGATYGRTKECM